MSILLLQYNNKKEYNIIKEVIALAIKDRKVFTTATTPELKEELDKLSKKTRLTISDLVTEALEDLLKKYELKIKLYEK